MKGIKSYVFSRTLTSIPGKGVELVTDDAGAFVRKLKAQPGKDIIVMSGGNFATSLLEAGAIDEIGLNVHPVLLGAGVPVPRPRQARGPRADGMPSARRRVCARELPGQAIAGTCIGRTLMRYPIQVRRRPASSVT